MTVIKDNFPMDTFDNLIFSREPLRLEETILACKDGSFRRNLTQGTLITNQAVWTWSNKRVERFPFVDMEEMDVTRNRNSTLNFKFMGKKKAIDLTNKDGFFATFLDALPEHMTPPSIIKRRLYIEFLILEDQHEPQKSMHWKCLI